MEIKTNIYTSCYSKMLARHKNPNDIYIQVSRSLFLPKKGIDNKSMMSMIDLNFGQDLGMYDDSLEEYEDRIRGEEYKEILKDLAETCSKKFILESMGISAEELEEYEQGIQDLAEMKKEMLLKSYEENMRDWQSLKTEDKEVLCFYGFTEKNLEDIKGWEPCLTYNFFILCYEDLGAKWTEKDEKKYSNVRAGDFKFCHRTNLAKVLNERYDLNITEW